MIKGVFFVKKLICIFLCLCIFCVCAVADTIDLAENSVKTVDKSIATEYYSSDLTLEPTDFASTVPMNSVPEIKAKSVVLLERSTGKTLYQNNANEKLSPASVTKIMTLLLTVEAIDSGKISLSDKVITSDHAASMGGSQIWLEPGETMTVDELLKAAAVASANDASVALAEHICGSEEGFVARMNERAAELGMKNTVFKNACGLDEEGHYTSAYDIALMSKELLSHDTIKKYTTIWMDSLRDGKTELVNTNKLVRFYMGATGLKTGTTDKAGFCLAASAKRDGMELIAVVMAAESSNDRFTGAKKLLDYGFANYTLGAPDIDLSRIGSVAVTKGVKPSVDTQVDTLSEVLLKKGDKSKLKTDIKLVESVEAPVESGTQLGTLTVSVGEEKMCEYKIYAAESVDRISLLYSVKKIGSFLFGM